MAAARRPPPASQGREEPRGQDGCSHAARPSAPTRSSQPCMHAQPPARTTCTGHVSGQSAANLHSKQTFFLLLSASSDADSSWRRGIARCAAGAYCWLPCCRVLCGSLHALLDMRRDERGADGESDCDMLVGADVYCGHEQHGDAWPCSPSHRHKQVAAARAGSCSIPRRKLPRMEMDADESFGPPSLQRRDHVLPWSLYVELLYPRFHHADSRTNLARHGQISASTPTLLQTISLVLVSAPTLAPCLNGRVRCTYHVAHI